MKRPHTIFWFVVVAVVGVAVALGVYYGTRPVTPTSPPAERSFPLASEPQSPSQPKPEPAPPSPTASFASKSADSPPAALSICSFNVKWLGMYPERDDEALADIVKDHDIVVIQELIAPPYSGKSQSLGQRQR